MVIKFRHVIKDLRLCIGRVFYGYNKQNGFYVLLLAFWIDAIKC